jgi:chitinase
MVAVGNVVMAYFAGWSIYDRQFNVWDVDASKISHLNYAFADIKDGLVVLGDPYADAEKINAGHGDTFNDPAETLHGNLHQLFRLKQAHRHLKVGLSVGGWSWSAGFSAAAANERARKRFVASAVQLIHDCGLDYVDLDWEFPVAGGVDKEAASPNDGHNYVALLEEFTLQLAQHFPDEAARPFVTLAMSCAPHVYRHYPLAEMAKHVRYFSLMGYDFSGAWSPVSDHAANLFQRPPKTINGKTRLMSSNSVAEAIEHYLAHGIPNDKIVLGMPMYGRSFASCYGLHHPFQGADKGSWEPGLVDYKDIPAAGYLTKWERTTNASFAVNPVTRSFVSYDDVKAVAHKLAYIVQKGLGGAMFWELSADRASEDPASLLHMADTWLGGDALDRSPNSLCYPLSRYANIRGIPGCPPADPAKIAARLAATRNIFKPSPKAINAAVEQCIALIDEAEDARLSFESSPSDNSHANAVPSKVSKIISCYASIFPSLQSELSFETLPLGEDDVVSSTPLLHGDSSKVDDSLIDLVFEMIDLEKCEKAYHQPRYSDGAGKKESIVDLSAPSEKGQMPPPPTFNAAMEEDDLDGMIYSRQYSDAP